MPEKQAAGGRPAPRSGLLPIALALALTAGPLAAEGEGVGVTVWDLGILTPGKVYPTTITAVNGSCPGAHTVFVVLQGLPWFRVTGPTDGARSGAALADAVVDATSASESR